MDPTSHTDAHAEGLSFTDEAFHLLAEARREADRLRHEYIGTEHLLLALSGQPDDSGALARLGVHGGPVRELILMTVIPGHTDPAPGVKRPYTTRTKTVLSLAAEGARALGHTHIGSAHIILGMMREGRGIAGQVLQRHGLTAERVFEEVQRLSAGSSGS